MQPHESRLGLWLRIALLALLGWVAYLVVWGPRNRDDSLAAGQKADYAWTLEQLDGTKVSFEQFRGRPVFLNLWATWCGPCVAEMPSIARLAANPRVKEMAFVCISLDDDWERVRRFLREQKLDLTVMRPAGPVPEVFQTSAIPATFVIAADGTIVKAEQGALEWDRAENIAAIESVLTRRPAKR